jgi:hypothetical protein
MVKKYKLQKEISDDMVDDFIKLNLNRFNFINDNMQDLFIRLLITFFIINEISGKEYFKDNISMDDKIEIPYEGIDGMTLKLPFRFFIEVKTDESFLD